MPIIAPHDMTAGQSVPIQTETPKQITHESTEASVTQPVAKKELMSPQLAALARRERALRQQARQIQAEKQNFQARQAEIEQNVANQWRQKLTQNPWDAMIEAGLTPDQATEIILNKPKPEDVAINQLKKELEAVKKAQEESVSKIDQQQMDQLEQAKHHMTIEAKLLVDNDATYEPIKQQGAVAAIPQLIEDVFNQGLPGKYQRGYVMSVEEAAQMVNEFIIDEGEKIAKLAAVQKRLNPTPSQQQPAQKPMTSHQQPQYTTTLSNRMTASTQTNLSDRERRERAILAYQGKL